MLYENFKKLCDERGTTPTAVALDMGISTSLTSRWKHGGKPRIETLNKIADYFGVSVSYLLGTTDDPTDVLSAQVISNLAASMQQVADELDKQKKPVLGLNPILSSLIDSMSKEELEDLERYAEFILSKKKG